MQHEVNSLKAGGTREGGGVGGLLGSGAYLCPPIPPTLPPSPPLRGTYSISGA